MSGLQRNTFKKHERLKSRKVIEQLFKEGNSGTCFPLKAFFRPATTVNGPAQAGFSVPKKSFKHATDRNRLKRLMRETYRLNKRILYNRLIKANMACSIMFVYISHEKSDYKTIEKSMKELLEKMGKALCGTVINDK